MGAISGGSSNPIFVSNKDKSLCGFLHKKDNQEAYEKLLKKVQDDGYRGCKGYFYSLLMDEKPAPETTKSQVSCMKVKINIDRILPVEKW